MYPIGIVEKHVILQRNDIYIYICIYIHMYLYTYIHIYQGAPGLIRVKTGLAFLRSRFDWVTFLKYLHGFARVGFGQVSSLPGFGQVGFVRV